MSPKKKIAVAVSAFGANLRRERTARELTQEKLAELADLNIRTVQKIEAGEINILITTACRIQKALGCAWERLMP
ncbi:MAG: helix-turn-helix transcriptional regulator [Verrucomicrobia bacterium]|nr:helix-turn-helix transcriptional regulator [Verrucomicrobiota bacterium]